MLPRPSRLKSLASELSPVFTTPPPVEPNTVLVLISVPEMMLSSNFVVLRRRAAMRPAINARMPSAPAPIAQVGVLPMSSSRKEGSVGGALDALTGVVAVLVSGALASGALLSGALASGALASGALISGAFASGAFGSSAFVGGTAAAGGSTTACGGATVAD